MRSGRRRQQCNPPCQSRGNGLASRFVPRIREFEVGNTLDWRSWALCIACVMLVPVARAQGEHTLWRRLVAGSCQNSFQIPMSSAWRVGWCIVRRLVHGSASVTHRLCPVARQLGARWFRLFCSGKPL